MHIHHLDFSECRIVESEEINFRGPESDNAVFRDRKNIPYPDNRDFAWPQYDERMR
jgi:hypothetical protein